MQIVTPKQTPEIAPIDHDTSQIILTPITSGLICQQIEDIMQDFMLDGGNSYIFQTKSQSKRRRIKKGLFKDNLAIHMFKLDCDLQRIIENEDEESYYSSNQSFIDEQSEFYDEQCLANSNTLISAWSSGLKSKDSHTLDIDEEKQTSFDIINVDYSEKIESYSKNPKMVIIKKIREIQMLAQDVDQQQKRLLIKNNLEKYLLDCQLFCFQQSWKQLGSSFSQAISLIIEGVQETFAKKIGNLSFQSRRVKLLKYLQKKKKRIWRKKVSYDCRKKVADGRLRIKGKFVTRQQACEQLGAQNLDNYNADEIKQMLQRKIDQRSVNQSTLSYERDSKNI